MFSPKPVDPSHNRGTYFHIGTHAGFNINSDSYDYVKDAIDLHYLFTDKEVRQSRPIYILMGSITGYSIYYLTYPIHKGESVDRNKKIIFYLVHIIVGSVEQMKI